MRKTISAVAVVFGLVTVAAGGRVLAGADPGYVVFLPLLVFNVLMGVGYVAAGVAIWRNQRWGRRLASGVFITNLAVLLAIIGLRYAGGPVAVDSVQAMAFRTAVWMVIALISGRVTRRS